MRAELPLYAAMAESTGHYFAAAWIHNLIARRAQTEGDYRRALVHRLECARVRHAYGITWEALHEGS